MSEYVILLFYREMMEQKLFLELLRKSLHQEAAVQVPEKDAPWKEVFELAEIHHVLPMVVDAAYRLEKDRIPELLLELYRRKAKQTVFLQAMRTGAFLAFYRFLTEQGLKPLVMKGIVCRSLYPEPDFRFSADEDLLIPPNEILEYQKAFKAYGLQEWTPGQEAASKEASEQELFSGQEFAYAASDGSLQIELHRYPFPQDSAAYGNYNAFFENVFDRSEELEVQGQIIRTLAPTDHLFYLICHAMKHFLHGGFGIRQVADIALFAEAYGKEIDWESFFNKCKAIQALPFTAAIFRIAEQHLGMDRKKACIPDSLFGSEEQPGVSDAQAEALLSDILESGVYGASTLSRKHSSNITLGAVEEASREKKSSNKKASGTSSGIGRALLPPFRTMKSRYPVLERKPYLLPAMWVRRIGSYLIHQEKGSDSAKEAIRIGKDRVQLMGQLGMIPNSSPEATKPKPAESAPRIIDTSEYVSAILSILEEGKEVPLPVKGSSMTPFLADGRDRVFLKKAPERLRRGDIILYQRDNGVYVLHRICRIRKHGTARLYDLVGDAQTRIEHDIRRDQIHAKAVRIERKGVLKTPGTFYWWFFQHIWVSIIPMRHLVLHLYSVIR